MTTNLYPIIPRADRKPLGHLFAAKSPEPSRTLVTHVDLGTIYIERDGEQVRVDADEVPALVRSLLMHADAIGDAS